MVYQFTYTPRFQKHFQSLTQPEKKQLMSKLKLLAENPRTRPCAQNGFRVLWICTSAASIWTFVLFGITKGKQ